MAKDMPDNTAPSMIEDYKRRVEALRSERAVLNSHLEDVAEHILPNGLGFIGTRVAGEKRMSKVYDETGINANELLAASLGGSVTNQSSKWFSIRVLDSTITTENGQDVDLNDVPAVKKWRSDVENILFQEMYAPGSNLSPTLDEFYLSLGAFGTAIYFIGETTKGRLQFQSRALHECYVSQNADDVIDELFRCFKQTVRQIMASPDWKPSDKVRELHSKGKYDESIDVCHYVGPRENYDPNKRGRKNMPFTSCYFETETCHELEQGGFPEFPYVCARWRKYAGETYGRSPGMTALPAVKMLQAIEVDVIKIMQKLSNPPMWLRDDGVTGAQRTIPGALNFWRGNPNEGIMQLPTSDKIPIALDWVEGIRNRIRTVFHNDHNMLLDDRERTLGEAQMRRSEQMRLQGPVSGRLDAEMLGPTIERVFGILSRKGKIPPAPEVIQERQFTVEFVSPLANAQKKEQLSGFAELGNYMAPYGEPAMMALAKRINWQRTIDGVWESLAIDPDWLNTNEETAAIEQKEQQMQQMGMAQQGAQAANDGAGAVNQLADAQASGGIDMQALMQRLGPAMAAGAQARQRAA